MNHLSQLTRPAAQGEVLLRSKLYRPPPRADAVRRPRLTGHLDRLLEPGQAVPLALISAPPGFGKTSLLAEWAETCAAAVAWLALDAADNDPARFLTYLIAAIREAQGPASGQSAAELLGSQPPMPVEAVLAALLDELGSPDRALVIVLDDYQAIEAPSIHQAVRFLVEHLPPQVHLALATRADPPLPLARLRARGQLIELRAANLRFTAREAGELLSRSAGLAIEEDSDEDSLATALAERTEGWVAGLQMAALSLAGPGKQAPDPQAFLRAFTGSHRYVLDYLTEEVLAHLPEEMVSFLLNSAVLERLSAGLCAAVVLEDGQRTTGEIQALLEELERANLFLVPLDDTRTWYRYHHLFADLLRARLKQKHPERIPALHARAAAWYEQQGIPTEAVSHWLAAARAADIGPPGNETAAGHYKAAAILIESCAMELFLRGEAATFLTWVDALPVGIVNAHPLLDLFRAAVYGLSGDIEASQRITAAVQARLRDWATVSEDSAGLQAVTYHLAGIQVAQLDLQDRLDEVIQLAQPVLAEPGLDPINRVTLLLSLGHAYFSQGDLQAALATWAEAEQQVDPQHNPYGLALATAHQARTERVLGDLTAAQARLERGLALLARQEEAQWMGLSVLEVGLGDLLRERNALAEARRLLESAQTHPTRFGGLNGRVLAEAALVRLCLAEGAPGAAQGHLKRLAIYLPHAAIYPEYREEAETARALALLASGQLAQLSAWADEIDMDEAGLRGESARMGTARTRLALGQAIPATMALERIAATAMAAKRWSRVIEAQALLSAAYYQAGQTEKALAALGQALTAAAPRGHVRAILDAGLGLAEGLMPGLLALGIRQGIWTTIQVGYAKSLLAHCPALPGAAEALYGERLSEREVEVLALVAEGLSNAEIAARLVLSTGTVRAHTANLYRKLDVSSRTQAVARARELGILPDSP